MKIPYSKQVLNPSESVSILQSRGLLIENESKAEEYLRNIGYFRLSAYFYPLLKTPKTDHIYKSGTSFKQVLDLYRFDRKFRILIFNEIEKIEVSVRSIMVNTACEYFDDAFWITEAKYFYNQQFFENSKSEIDSEYSKSKEDFILHFRNNYTDPYPPSWVIAEILPLGNICRIYKNIRDTNLKKKIAQRFGLQPIAFESWIMTIAGLRNICCHHGRLWNRLLMLKTVLPNKTAYPWMKNPNAIEIQRVYFRLCMIKYFLFTVSPNNTFKQKLVELLEKYPMVDIKAMGFSSDWDQEPLWR